MTKARSSQKSAEKEVRTFDLQGFKRQQKTPADLKCTLQYPGLIDN